MRIDYKILTDCGHCQLKFDNGYVVSIFNGFGSYTKDGDNRRRLYPSSFGQYYTSVSDDCEVAVISPNGVFVTDFFTETEEDNPEIKGYVTPDELADIISKVKNLSEEDLLELEKDLEGE